MRKILFGLSLLSGILFGACIREEAPNSECDIERVIVTSPHAEALFFNPTDTVKDITSADSVIVFFTRDRGVNQEHLKNLKVFFQLTPGATITPENGSEQDFSEGKNVYYRITSEDGLWHRNYRVHFAPMEALKTILNFEDTVLLEGKNNTHYYGWFETNVSGTQINMWASGNPGFAISKSSATKDEYPTIPWKKNAINGNAVKLETKDTGGFGAMVNMRIAAGNLFIGTFDVENALKDAMAATRFGLPFNKKPIRFEGYYQFQPGATFQDRQGRPQEGRIDQPDIYAVLYKNTDDADQPITLKGDDVLTHPNIVAMARLFNPVHGTIGTDWQHFDIPFEYRKEIDPERLKEHGYNLAVVFTSSIEGATFCGAIGSTLLVDEVKITCEED